MGVRKEQRRQSDSTRRSCIQTEAEKKCRPSEKAPYPTNEPVSRSRCSFFNSQHRRGALFILDLYAYSTVFRAQKQLCGYEEAQQKCAEKSVQDRGGQRWSSQTLEGTCSLPKSFLGSGEQSISQIARMSTDISLFSAVLQSGHICCPGSRPRGAETKTGTASTRPASKGSRKARHALPATAEPRQTITG